MRWTTLSLAPSSYRFDAMPRLDPCQPYHMSRGSFFSLLAVDRPTSGWHQARGKGIGPMMSDGTQPSAAPEDRPYAQRFRPLPSCGAAAPAFLGDVGMARSRTPPAIAGARTSALGDSHPQTSVRKPRTHASASGLNIEHQCRAVAVIGPATSIIAPPAFLFILSGKSQLHANRD
jgi:hypothetical protein